MLERMLTYHLDCYHYYDSLLLLLFYVGPHLPLSLSQCAKHTKNCGLTHEMSARQWVLHKAARGALQIWGTQV